jgi:hypothetical protein
MNGRFVSTVMTWRRSVVTGQCHGGRQKYSGGYFIREQYPWRLMTNTPAELTPV